MYITNIKYILNFATTLSFINKYLIAHYMLVILTKPKLFPHTICWMLIIVYWLYIID